MTTRQSDNAEFWRIVGQGERARQFESGELVSAGDAPFGFGRAALTRAAWEATGAHDLERLLVVLASAKVAIVFHLVSKGVKTGRLLYSAGPFAPDCSRVALLIVSTRDDEGRRATTFMVPDEAAACLPGQNRTDEEGEAHG